MRTVSFTDLKTESTAKLKGTMSPQAHVCVDDKHFETVGPTFSNTVGVQEAVFICLNRVQFTNVLY